MIYYKASRDVHDLLQQLVVGYYPDLDKYGVTFCILLVHPSENAVDKPPLKANGVPVNADVKVINYESRVGGMPDVKIKLSAPAWSSFNDREKAFVLDSQLYRLELVREKAKKGKKGQDQGELAVLTDDCGRPKVKIRPYDHAVFVQTAMVRRHGADALDAREVSALYDEFRPLLVKTPDVTAKADDRPASEEPGD